MKDIDKILKDCKEKAKKNTYCIQPSTGNIKVKVNMSPTSENLVNGFFEAFIEELNKKINLKRCLDKSKSKEIELIQNIKMLLLLAGISETDSTTITKIKDLITRYEK